MSSASSISAKYQVGDLVWAKMKGFSPWPGKIVDASSANMKKPPGNYRYKQIQCVYFFGSNNFAWIQEDAIKPYHDFKDQNCKTNKSHAFKEAVEKIEEYIKKGGEDDKLGEISTDGNVNDKLGDGGAEGNEPLNNSNDDGANKGNNNNATQATNLPSIDEEIATIFTEKAGKGDEKTTVSGSNTTSSAQRDYSRTPFKSKPKKTGSSNSSGAASTSVNDEDAPPAKKTKTADESSSSSGTSSKSPTKGARNLLARTSQYLLDSNSDVNNDTELDLGNVSAKSKSIRASSLKFGFIGLGLMGQRLLKNLLNSGHSVTIWNRTPSKCKDFVKVGANKATTPADVVAAADIIFSCLADPHAVKEIVFGNCGVLAEMRNGKGYVEMTSIDPDTSNDISEAIIARGGKYLEAPVIGSGKAQADEGNLTIIVAGDKSLFDDCNSCFQAISKHAFYLGGQVGDASKMGLVLSMLIGNLIGSLAESMALADRTGLSQKDLLEILSLSPLNCQTLISKGKAMIEGGFATEMPLTHMQKDLRLALQLAEVYEHPLPITASTNEVFKHAKHLGYSEHDVAAVYIRSRF